MSVDDDDDNFCGTVRDNLTFYFTLLVWTVV